MGPILNLTLRFPVKSHRTKSARDVDSGFWAGGDDVCLGVLDIENNLWSFVGPYPKF